MHSLSTRKQDREVRCGLISSLNTAYTSVYIRISSGCDVKSLEYPFLTHVSIFVQILTHKVIEEHFNGQRIKL